VGRTCVGYESLARVAWCCPHLTGLCAAKNVSGEVADAVVFIVATRCRNLRYLDVRTTDDKAVCDESLIEVALRCPQVRHVLVNDADKMSHAAENAFRAHCGQYRSGNPGFPDIVSSFEPV